MKRRRGKPYDPGAATKAHDRRATDFGGNRDITFEEVDDPMALEPGDKSVVAKSFRDDTLLRLKVRQQITAFQYEAGRDYQRDWEIAERGPRAIDPSKEAVDGGRTPEPITEGQRRAAKHLARAHRSLGEDGSAIIQDVLVHKRSMSQVAQRRSLCGRSWEEFFGKRFRECLNTLAVCYGRATRSIDVRTGCVEIVEVQDYWREHEDSHNREALLNQ